MKFSESWLREQVSVAAGTDELIEQLTMAGLEVDGVEPVADDFEGIVVAEVLEVGPHPDADKLRVCKVDAGTGHSDGAPLQIVCGAPNVEAGGRFPLATVGGRLADGKIRKAKLRGVESFGMLCSERELGISDNHDGLYRLPDDAPVGTSIRDYLGLDDRSIELDLTPNRSDCLGMRGLAREVGVLFEAEVAELPIPEVPAVTDATHAIDVQSPEGCPRYVGRVIEDFDLAAVTPLWMAERLRRAGLRSIDPIVDVTNYVMLELGQPLHAFDLDTVEGPIGVRFSTAGEKFTLLDGRDIELNDETLLITDDVGPIGMAGIMGGLRTAVSEGTRRIFLESAFFTPVAIAGRARHYGMATDAAHRFERGVDWAGQRHAVERATALLVEIAGGRPGPVSEVASVATLPETTRVRLRYNRVAAVLGVRIEPEAIVGIMERLGFALEVADDTRAEGPVWEIAAPSHRFDIAIEEDLIEEISRVYGYNRLPTVTPIASLQMTAVTETELPVRRLKAHLVTRGYQEAITYSFVDEASQKLIDPENDPIGLANPISSEMNVMRTSLWSGLVKSLIYNRNRQQERVRLFEVGLRFLQPPNQDGIDLAVVRQEKVLAGVALGTQSDKSWAAPDAPMDFFDLKGDVESMLALTGNPDEFSFERAVHPALHDGQCARVKRGNEDVGVIGMLAPHVQQALDVAEPVFGFELRVETLCRRTIPRFAELSRFPEVRRDLAVLVPLEVTAKALTDCISEASDDSLVNLKLFDVYQGKGVDPTRKSIAVGLTFQHPSRTLTDSEVTDAFERIVASLTSGLGASLRN